MVVNGSLAGPEIHFELRYYFELNELFITNFYCMLGEYGIYVQIRAIKGKYNQIGANKG